MNVKRGNLVVAVESTTHIEAGTKCIIMKGGKTPTLAFDYNAHKGCYATIKMDARLVEMNFKPSTFKSKFDIVNQIDMSNLKAKDGWEPGSKMTTGYVVYKGQKIQVENSGSGGPTCVLSNIELAKEINQLMKEQIPYMYDWYKPSLEGLVEWSQGELHVLSDIDEEYNREINLT